MRRGRTPKPLEEGPRQIAMRRLPQTEVRKNVCIPKSSILHELRRFFCNTEPQEWPPSLLLRAVCEVEAVVHCPRKLAESNKTAGLEEVPVLRH
jgi:hypothetical protein